MLDLALKFLENELNTYLLTQGVDSNSVKAKMTKLVDDTGKYAFEEEDQVKVGTIGIFIINIEEERIFKSQVPEHTYTNGQYIVVEPELNLNLHVLFAAKFTKYEEALKHISYVLTFFQSHPAFTSVGYPALDFAFLAYFVCQTPKMERRFPAYAEKPASFYVRSVRMN